MQWYSIFGICLDVEGKSSKIPFFECVECFGEDEEHTENKIISIASQWTWEKSVILVFLLKLTYRIYKLGNTFKDGMKPGVFHFLALIESKSRNRPKYGTPFVQLSHDSNIICDAGEYLDRWHQCIRWNT